MASQISDSNNLKEFATSYICSQIPWKRVELESESVQGFPIPFKKLILAPFFLNSSEIKLKNEISKSEKQFRKKSTQQEQEGSTSMDVSNPVEALYKDAIRFCKSNDQLVSHLVFPKLNTNSLRNKFTDLHQEAMLGSRKELKIHKSKSLVVEQDMHEGRRSPRSRLENQLQQSKEELWKNSESENMGSLSIKLAAVFDEIKPLKYKSSSQKTQYEKIIKDPIQIESQAKAKKPRRYWKQNRYPPKTPEEIIAEKRAQAPRLRQEEMELDYLPGIWEPSLFRSEFELTGPNYDSRLLVAAAAGENCEVEFDERYEPISWYEMRECLVKCNDWLNSFKI